MSMKQTLNDWLPFLEKEAELGKSAILLLSNWAGNAVLVEDNLTGELEELD